MDQKVGGLPSALIFPISTLDFFVGASYDFLFEDFGASSFVYSGDFEDLGCVETVVGLALHGGYIPDCHFDDGYIRVASLYPLTPVTKRGREKIPCICR